MDQCFRILIILFMFSLAVPANAQPSSIACTMEAKLCPDGSYVARTGPRCEFAPCSSSSAVPSVVPGRPPVIQPGGTVTVPPARIINPSDIGLNKYADYSLGRIPSGPQSVKFIIEHRTALNDRRVTVQGIIVRMLLGEEACPSSDNTLRMGRPCAMPRITIADTDNEGRNTRYDLTIMLPQDDGTIYNTGYIVKVFGTVTGNKSSVMMFKNQAGTF